MDEYYIANASEIMSCELCQRTSMPTVPMSESFFFFLACLCYDEVRQRGASPNIFNCDSHMVYTPTCRTEAKFHFIIAKLNAAIPTIMYS